MIALPCVPRGPERRSAKRIQAPGAIHPPCCEFCCDPRAPFRRTIVRRVSFRQTVFRCRAFLRGCKTMCLAKRIPAVRSRLRSSRALLESDCAQKGGRMPMVPSLLRSSRILLQNNCAFHAVLGAVKALGKADTCPWCHLRCDPRESFRKAIAPPMGSSEALKAFYKADGYMGMVPSPFRSLRVVPQSDCVPKGSSGPSHVGDMRSSNPNPIWGISSGVRIC